MTCLSERLHLTQFPDGLHEDQSLTI